MNWKATLNERKGRKMTSTNQNNIDIAWESRKKNTTIVQFNDSLNMDDFLIELLLFEHYYYIGTNNFCLKQCIQ